MSWRESFQGVATARWVAAAVSASFRHAGRVRAALPHLTLRRRPRPGSSCAVPRRTRRRRHHAQPGWRATRVAHTNPGRVGSRAHLTWVGSPPQALPTWAGSPATNLGRIAASPSASDQPGSDCPQRPTWVELPCPALRLTRVGSRPYRQPGSGRRGSRTWVGSPGSGRPHGVVISHTSSRCLSWGRPRPNRRDRPPCPTPPRRGWHGSSPA